MKCMFPRLIYQLQLKGCCVSVELEDSSLTSRYYQPAGVSACLKLILYASILTPNDDVSFILESLTNRSHQVNSIIPLGPCFAVFVYDENGWPMLTAHLSYKPPIYWRILFWSGWWPRKFISMKCFRALVFPSRGCRNGVIIQGRHLNRRFYCGRSVMIKKKRGCNRSVYPCTYTEEYYVWTYGQKVYLRDQTDQTP